MAGYGQDLYSEDVYLGQGAPTPNLSNTVQISASAAVGGDPHIPEAPVVPYDPRWVGVGRAAALVPFDNQSGLWMFDLLPEWYRTIDSNTPGHPGVPEMAEWGQLRRFIEILGQMYDNLRSESDTIADVYNPGSVRVDLLQNFSETYGFPYEPNIGSAPLRALHANWFYILKRKGTFDATLKFVESITNYPTEIEIGSNLLLTTNDSAGQESVGFWHSTGNDLISAVTPNAPYLATCTTALHATAQTEATPQAMSYIDADVSTARNVQLTAIPLQDVNAPHYYSIAFKWFDIVTFTSFTPTLTVSWYDGNGAFISTVTGLGTTFDSNMWTVCSLDGVIPATGAKYAVLGWTLPFPGHNKRLRFTGVSFSDEYPFTVEATPQRIPYTPPKEVQIKLYPTRVNWFPNPNFESAAHLYFERVSAEYTTAQTTEQSNPLTYATHSMKVTLDPLVRGVEVTSDIVGPHGHDIPITEFVPGDVWAFMISVFPGQVPGDEILIPFIKLIYLDFSEEYIEPVITEPNLGYTWTQLIAEATVPPESVHHLEVGVRITEGPIAGNSVYYFDSVMIERNTFPYFYGYFDGNLDLTSADFIWAAENSDSPSMYFPNRYMRDKRLRELLPDFLPPLCAFDIQYVLPAV